LEAKDSGGRNKSGQAYSMFCFSLTNSFDRKTKQNLSIFALTSWYLLHTVMSGQRNCYVSKTPRSVHSLRVSRHNSPHRSLKDIPLKTAFARQSVIANDKARMAGALPANPLSETNPTPVRHDWLSSDIQTERGLRRELGAVQVHSPVGHLSFLD
jgi:hypothetical protein